MVRCNGYPSQTKESSFLIKPGTEGRGHLSDVSPSQPRKGETGRGAPSSGSSRAETGRGAYGNEKEDEEGHVGVEHCVQPEGTID